jgi:hypothetical protein
MNFFAATDESFCVAFVLRPRNTIAVTPSVMMPGMKTRHLYTTSANPSFGAVRRGFAIIDD